METLLDLLEGTATRFAERNALGMRGDDGSRFHWSYPRSSVGRASPRGGSGRSACSPVTAC